ncbi:MAG: hypothetical protein C5S52_01920 [ANME-2 cluster archaeon]|nr:hypothetical protein [ANME-2 cluster archaeon]
MGPVCAGQGILCGAGGVFEKSWSSRDLTERSSIFWSGARVIDKELASDLSNLVYQRNILAHEYHNLTEKDVFRTYRRVYVIRKFVERVK